MKIGLTYDLKKDYTQAGFNEEALAEFDSQETVEAIQASLQKLGHQVIRIGNLFQLVKRLSRGDRWDLVFNICEGLYGRSREAQVPALLEAYGLPYTFSDPLTLALTLDKALAKKIIQAAQLSTANFFIVATEQDLQQGIPTGFAFPLFIKPVAEGTGKGISVHSIVHTAEAWQAGCRKLLQQYHQPVLVETYLPGREFTVGIWGSGEHAQAIGVLEVLLLEQAEPGAYSYANKKHYTERIQYQLVREVSLAQAAETLALAAYRALECRDVGRIDLRADANGQLNFLEINPLPGLHPIDSDLPILCRESGITYDRLIQRILFSSLERQAAVPAAQVFSAAPR